MHLLIVSSAVPVCDGRVTSTAFGPEGFIFFTAVFYWAVKTKLGEKNWERGPAERFICVRIGVFVYSRTNISGRYWRWKLTKIW